MQIAAHPLLSGYQWQNRLLLVFSPQEEDRSYKLQLDELGAAQAGLQERHLLVFHIFDDRALLPDQTLLGAPEARSLRAHYAIPEKETVVLLIGKDGKEKLRSRELLTTQRLFATIDAMPMRQQEIRE